MNVSFERPNLDDLPLTMKLTMTRKEWKAFRGDIIINIGDPLERYVAVNVIDYIDKLLAPVERIAQERNHTSRGNANE